MLNFAVIGTNWITDKFVHAAEQTNLPYLKAVYSRISDTAKLFAKSFNAVDLIFDDHNELANAKEIDAVYIPSPNSLHYEQAILMMKHGKHVIYEKPLASNYEQALTMFEVAKANNVVLFEAYKTEYLPNFNAIKEQINHIGKVHKVHFNYCQYSSRCQKYLNGENPNTFNPEFSNGSLVDIGYYCVAAAITLFDKPSSVIASAHKLDSGVDAHGSAIFVYSDFELIISHSKVTDSSVPSEIQGEDGSIVINHIAECDGFSINYRNGHSEDIQHPQFDNSMFYEAKEFAETILDKSLYQSQRALLKIEMLTEMRCQCGIKFPSDRAVNN